MRHYNEDILEEFNEEVTLMLDEENFYSTDEEDSEQVSIDREYYLDQVAHNYYNLEEIVAIRDEIRCSEFYHG